MSKQVLSKSNNKFIHFGCWNNLNNDKSCLNEVINTLEKNILDVDFIIVAGDNYYPEKKKEKASKKKYIYVERLRQGLTKLANIRKHIYMILGNHDLETNLDNNGNLYVVNEETKEEAKEESCRILTEEIKITDSLYNYINYDFFFSKIINDTLILMIDTSIYSLDAEHFFPCYEEFFPKIKIQNKLILENINEHNGNIKNLILIGHHPITGIKKKNEKYEYLNDIPSFKSLLIGSIFDILQDKVNYYYLCADLHLYQEGKITLKAGDKTMVIHQHIVGTGGTELDDEVDIKEVNSKENPVEISKKAEDIEYYKLIKSIKKCGFLKCDLNSELPNFLFIEIDTNDGKGKKTKRKKRKKKVKKTRKKRTKKRIY